VISLVGIPEDEGLLLGELNTKFSERNVWLLKVPKFLYQTWSSTTNSNLELGRVRFFDDSTISLQVHGSVKEYRLDFTPVDDPLFIFSEDHMGNVAIEGKVQQKGNVTPIFSSEYSQVCKERTQEAEKKLRVTKKADDERIKPAYVSTVTTTTTSAAFPLRITGTQTTTYIDNSRKKRSEMVIADKRERMEEDALIDLILLKFESKEHYTLKDLAAETRQPTVYLKEVLQKLCNYNKKGPNKTMYELKEEYKQHNTQQPKSPTNEGDTQNFEDIQFS